MNRAAVVRKLASQTGKKAVDDLTASLSRIHMLMRQSERLERLHHHVEEHYFEPLRLNDVATIVSLERVYCCKYIQRKIGQSFGAWLRMVRVERAIHLLRTTPRTITDIALSVGFADAGGLQRSCKRVTGHCPRTIRLALLDEISRQTVEGNFSRDSGGAFK
jgi:transcriptional regulator GlxA family with amidase domain